ncbi:MULTISPECIES: hypothetical protein [unclassified Mesorhizobium]|uniref:hypothetical protein n=1 Tax=unclassified Mesorhizobium TaxID=325217 RepID=UPI001FD897FB|nr:MULTISPECIES: hypothetical protein [unclassified Mesorhizobium]
MNLALIPLAVRQHEIQEPLFLVRRLFRKQSAGVACQLQQPDAVLHVRFLGATMTLYLAKQPRLFSSPLCRHPVVEGVVDAAIELVEIHGVQPNLEPIVLDLASMDRLFLLATLVGVAGHEGCLHPFQYLFVEMQSVEQLGECLIEHFLADIFAPTVTVSASAFVGMPGAVIVDVFALLDLRYDGAAAFGASHQAGKGELVSYRVGRHRIAARQDALDPLP